MFDHGATSGGPCHPKARRGTCIRNAVMGILLRKKPDAGCHLAQTRELCAGVASVALRHGGDLHAQGLAAIVIGRLGCHAVLDHVIGVDHQALHHYVGRLLTTLQAMAKMLVNDVGSGASAEYIVLGCPVLCARIVHKHGCAKRE
jgi:hypothetical protein